MTVRFLLQTVVAAILIATLSLRGSARDDGRRDLDEARECRQAGAKANSKATSWKHGRRAASSKSTGTAQLLASGDYDLSKAKADVLALDAIGMKAALLLNTSAKKTPRAVLQLPGLKTIQLYDGKYPANPPIQVPDYWDKHYRTELSKFANAIVQEFSGSKNVVALVIGFGTKYPEPNLTLGTKNTLLVNHNGSVQNQSDEWAKLGLNPGRYAELLIEFATTLQRGLPSVVQIRFPFHMTATGFLGSSNRFQFVRLMFRPIVASPIGPLAAAQLSNLSSNTPTFDEARANPACTDERNGKPCGELLLPRELRLPIGFEFVGPVSKGGRRRPEMERVRAKPESRHVVQASVYQRLSSGLRGSREPPALVEAIAVVLRPVIDSPGAAA